MPITTYAQLQSSIADWIARSDLTPTIPDFIVLAEARLKRGLSGTAFERETTLTANPLAANPRRLTLPTDFVEPVKLEIVESSGITLLTPQTPVSMGYSADVGRPAAWCINGDYIDLDRPVDAAYSLNFRYRWKLALSDASPTNWLLEEYPDLYLSASLAEAYRYTKNPEGAALWDQRASAQIVDINSVVARSKSLAVLTAENALLRRRTTYAELESGAF